MFTNPICLQVRFSISWEFGCQFSVKQGCESKKKLNNDVNQTRNWIKMWFKQDELKLKSREREREGKAAMILIGQTTWSVKQDVNQSRWIEIEIEQKCESIKERGEDKPDFWC